MYVCAQLEVGCATSSCAPHLCHDLGSHANLINSSTSRQPGLISGNLKRRLCDPTSLHEPDIWLRHTFIVYTHNHARIHTDIQILTHKYTKMNAHQGDCHGCKDFPSDTFPLAWRETLPEHPPCSPFLVSPLFRQLQKVPDTQLQVKGLRVSIDKD